MLRLIRAWFGTPVCPVVVEVILPQPDPRLCERRACQEALAEVIAAQGIVGVPLDSSGRPHITGIEAV